MRVTTTSDLIELQARTRKLYEETAEALRYSRFTGARIEETQQKQLGPSILTALEVASFTIGDLVSAIHDDDRDFNFVESMHQQEGK